MKLKSFAMPAMIFTLPFLMLACQKSGDPAPQAPVNPINKDLVSYDLNLNMGLNQIADLEVIQLVLDLNSKKPVSFSLVTKKLEELSVQHQKKEANIVDLTPADFNKKLMDLSKDLQWSTFNENKQKYEKNLKASFAEKDLLYNRDYISAVDVVKFNRMQCYSGTQLNVLLHRHLGDGLDYRKQNFIVILSKGHIQPGQLTTDPQNNKHVIAIETTLSGSANIELGSPETLSATEKRIIDADYWALITVLKNHLSLSQDQLNSLVEQAITATEAKYQIKVLSTATIATFTKNMKQDKNSNEEGTPTASNDKKDLLNQDPFGFGSANVPSGDLPRKSDFAIGGENGSFLSGSQSVSNKITCENCPEESVTQRLFQYKTENEDLSLELYVWVNNRNEINDFDYSKYYNYPYFYSNIHMVGGTFVLKKDFVSKDCQVSAGTYILKPQYSYYFYKEDYYDLGASGSFRESPMLLNDFRFILEDPNFANSRLKSNDLTHSIENIKLKFRSFKHDDKCYNVVLPDFMKIYGDNNLEEKSSDSNNK